MKLGLLLPISYLGLCLAGINSLAVFGAYADGEAEAKTIFIDLSLCNNVDNPAIQFKDESSEVLDALGNGIYRSQNPIALPIQSFRIVSNGNPLDWIEDTSPLSKPRYNYICVTGTATTYGYYGEKTKNPDATYATQRIWLQSDLSTSKDPWGNRGQNAVGYAKDNQYAITVMESILCNGSTYYFADIPADSTGFDFLSLASAKDHDYTYIRREEIKTISYGCCYTIGANGQLTTTAVYGADAGLLAEVVSAYLTFGKQPSNGCTVSTLQSVYNTFFANKSATDNDLKATKILDYTGYTANNNSYEGLTKNASFSVNEKWNTMCSNAGIDSKTGQIREFTFNLFSSATGKALLIILGIGLIAGIAIGAIPFVKLYKRNKDL